MKTDITHALVEEHRLILRMLDLLEERARRTAAGEYADYRFYLEGVDFIRNYADRFHHAKEEDVLFDALVRNGMPRENSPVAAMLIEHDMGRAYVRGIEQGAREGLEGKPSANALIAENALAYVEMLRGHIDKEDSVLYPLAERLLPEEVRGGITAAYGAAEARTPADFTSKYRRLVERCEAEA